MASGTDKAMTVNLPADLAGQLDQFIKATGRTVNAVTVEALRSYVEAESRQIRDIEQGIEEADRGEFATEGEVHAFFAKYTG